MATAKKTKAKKGAGTKRKPPKRKAPKGKVPLILQPRKVKLESGEVKEVTVAEMIVLAVRAGMFRAEAARAAGIARTSIFNWEQRGEDAIALAQEHVDPDQQVTEQDVPEADRPYVAFAYQLEEAEAECEMWHVRNVKAHALKDFRASTWFLARRWPERWGTREAAGAGAGGATLADIEQMVDEAAQEA